jgi:hypothetical protein
MVPSSRKTTRGDDGRRTKAAAGAAEVAAEAIEAIEVAVDRWRLVTASITALGSTAVGAGVA